MARLKTKIRNFRCTDELDELLRNAANEVGCPASRLLRAYFAASRATLSWHARPGFHGMSGRHFTHAGPPFHDRAHHRVGAAGQPATVGSFHTGRRSTVAQARLSMRRSEMFYGSNTIWR